jgi:TonB family protein
MASMFARSATKQLLWSALFALVSVGSAPLTASAQQTAYHQTSTSASCAVANAAATTRYAAQAETPATALLMHLTGTATVQVDIGRNGEVLNASIARTSGNGLLDRAALSAVRESSFTPAVRDCSPIASTSGFVVDFRD